MLVLTREGCHLCEQAVAIVDAVARRPGTPYATARRGCRPEVPAAYTDQVPVTFVDGREHDFWRVDPARLRAALTR